MVHTVSVDYVSQRFMLTTYFIRQWNLWISKDLCCHSQTYKDICGTQKGELGCAECGSYGIHQGKQIVVT